MESSSLSSGHLLLEYMYYLSDLMSAKPIMVFFSGVQALAVGHTNGKFLRFLKHPKISNSDLFPKT